MLAGLAFWREGTYRRCVIEGCQVEAGQALGVGEHVDSDDLPVRNGEAHDRQRPPGRSDYDSGGSVDQRRSHERREPREGERLCGHGPHAVDRDGAAGARRAAVGP
jgi:hypothetical protein